MKTTVIKPLRVPLDIRVDNARNGHPSDLHSVAVKIDRIANMPMSQYFELLPDAFDKLKVIILANPRTSFKCAASMIDKLYREGHEDAEAALWLFLAPLIKLDSLIDWGDCR